MRISVPGHTYPRRFNQAILSLHACWYVHIKQAYVKANLHSFFGAMCCICTYIVIHYTVTVYYHTYTVGSFITLFYTLILRLSIDVAEAGGTETIPQLLLRSPSYHHPCLHLLYALVASKHEPVILEIRKHLPVGAVCQILAMEHRPEVHILYVCSYTYLPARWCIGWHLFYHYVNFNN